MKQLSVLIGCYGDFPQLSLRAVRSVLDHCQSRASFDVHVGCNTVGRETSSALRGMVDFGNIETLIESRVNINKDPMMRLLLDRADTPYVMWMDDDSHVRAGWDRHLFDFMRETQFDVAGHVYFMHKRPDYLDFLRRRPWFRGDDCYLEPAHRDCTWFATGGLFVARTGFLRALGFPDRGMVKKLDDVLLGDLVSQQGGRLVQFSGTVMDSIVISDGNRRGAGEGHDGWRNAD